VAQVRLSLTPTYLHRCLARGVESLHRFERVVVIRQSRGCYAIWLTCLAAIDVDEMRLDYRVPARWLPPSVCPFLLFPSSLPGGGLVVMLCRLRYGHIVKLSYFPFTEGKSIARERVCEAVFMINSSGSHVCSTCRVSLCIVSLSPESSVGCRIVDIISHYLEEELQI